MTTEEHLWAAMANLHHELDRAEAQPLNQKLMQVLFAVRRRERDKAEHPLFAVVNHADDLDRGLRLVKSGEGPEAA